MIPSRPRSKSTGGIEKRASEEYLLNSLPKSTSVPSLADLFTPPPAIPQIRRYPVGSAASSKSEGKKRMLGERPEEDTLSGDHSIIRLSESPNSTETIKTHGGELFRCDNCRVAGDDRKAKAIFCPGGTGSCIFGGRSRSSEQFGASTL